MPNSRKKKNVVLVADSDSQTFKILNLILDSQNFEVVECSSGKQAIRLCVSIKPDIVLLDIQLPDMNSQEIIVAIREWSQVPVIIVATEKADDGIIKNLDAGADDYVQKPFSADVLRARINASLRKSAIHETGEPELENGSLRMDLVRHKVFLNDTLIAFTPKEYSLLRYFIVNRGKMLGHREILKEIWGAAHSDDTQYLRVFIGQIREKIETDPSQPKIIVTELGIGYRMQIVEKTDSREQSEMSF